MLYRSIFIIGSSQGKNKTLSKGARFNNALLKHNLRIKNTNTISYIDSNRSYLNLCKTSYSDDWINLQDDKVKFEQFNILKKDTNQIFKLFKKQLNLKNQKLIKQKQKHLIKNWSEFSANKQVTGEWIFSATREWFKTNGFIEFKEYDNFQIKNYNKILKWAEISNNWANKHISNLQHKKAFLASFLHLDESNVHLHFQFINVRKRYDKRTKTKIWSFSKNPKINPYYLKELHNDYRITINHELVKFKMIDKALTPKITQSKSVSLYRYKINSLQKQIQHLQIVLKTLSEIERSQYHSRTKALIYYNDPKIKKMLQQSKNIALNQAILFELKCYQPNILAKENILIKNYKYFDIIKKV